MNRLLKHIAMTTVVIFVASCTKSPIDREVKGDIADGELIEVTLDIKVAQPLTPGGDTKSRIVVSERTPSMLLEIIEEPDTKAVDEAKLENFWVFQYDSKLGNLMYKKYYAKYSAGQRFELKAASKESVVVIIGNTFDAAWGNSETVGSSPYKNLIDKNTTVTSSEKLLANNGKNIYMYGSYEGAVNVNTPIVINMARNIAHVTLRARLGEGSNGLAPTLQSINMQIRNLPTKSYFVPSDIENFPTIQNTTSYREQDMSGLKTYQFTDYSWYLPVNRRGAIIAATPATRYTFAPENATEIQISAIKSDGGTVYHIPLGENLSTDYNIRPNYKYIYQVTLYDDPDHTDSQVSEMGYVGMFGGDLVERNGIWSFTKPLYVAQQDINDGEYIQWATSVGDHSALAGINAPDSRTDGKGNTWRLNKNGNMFSAAKACIEMNINFQNIIAATNLAEAKAMPEYVWYLPAHTQWLAISMVNDYLSSYYGMSDLRWSSTEADENSSYGIDVGIQGNGSEIRDKTDALIVRCVR